MVLNLKGMSSLSADLDGYDESPKQKDKKKDTYDDSKKEYKKGDKNKSYTKDNKVNMSLFDDASEFYIESKKNLLSPIELLHNKIDRDYNSIATIYDLFDDKDVRLEKGCVVAALLAGYVSKKNYLKEEEKKEYMELITWLIKPRVKKFKKLVPEVFAVDPFLMEVAITFPTDDIVDPNKNIFELVSSLNKNISKSLEMKEIEEPSRKDVKKLYKIFFEKEMLPKCALACLIEDSEMFGDLYVTLSEFTFDILEKEEKDSIKKLLKMYSGIVSRKKPKIKFSEIDISEYDKVSSVVKDIKSEGGFHSKYL